MESSTKDVFDKVPLNLEIDHLVSPSTYACNGCYFHAIDLIQGSSSYFASINAHARSYRNCACAH